MFPHVGPRRSILSRPSGTTDCRNWSGAGFQSPGIRSLRRYGSEGERLGNRQEGSPGRFPLGRGKGRQAWVGRGVNGPPRRFATAVAVRHPSQGGDFQESRPCCSAAPPRMKMASPLGQGGTSGGFEGRKKPTPARRDRCRFAPPLRRRGFSGERCIDHSTFVLRER